MIALGFAWGVLCGIGTGTGAVAGHLLGIWVYPYQKYEQVPTILMFVPLGMMLGFFAGGWARISRPGWAARQMLSVVALSAGAYALAMFGYVQSRALPPGFGLDFEPYKPRASACTPATCPHENPPLDWTIEGHVRVTGMRLSGTVDAIEMEGMAETRKPSRPGGQYVITEPKGPTVRLAGDDLVGPRDVKSRQSISIPVRYSYRSRSGGTNRKIIVTVHLTDTEGRSRETRSVWEVQ